MLVIVVCADDALHEYVTNYVALVEEVEGDAVDAFENLGGFDQSAATRVGQIDLGDVAGDYRLRVEAEAGDEHLHLLRSSVLRLVEDNEGVIEGTSTHEGDGRDLDDVALQKSIDLLLIEQIVKCVIKRTQIGIDLLL